MVFIDDNPTVMQLDIGYVNRVEVIKRNLYISPGGEEDLGALARRASGPVGMAGGDGSEVKVCSFAGST